MTLGSFSAGTALENARFKGWYFFDYPQNDFFADASNILIDPFGDTTSLWDFRQPGEGQKGYQNPPGVFPAYNVFPGDTLVKTALSARDSVRLTLVVTQIPIAVSAVFSTKSHPPAVDSVRTLWLQDTVLQIRGPAVVKTLSLPSLTPQGIPILFAESGSSFQPGPPGLEGGLLFQNAFPAAKAFIPAFGGQNTPRGSLVQVKNLPPETIIRFSTIARAGRTYLTPLSPPAPRKRWRTLLQGGKVFGMRDSTTAEGSGLMKWGLVKTGVDAPFLKDSSAWVVPGNVIRPVLDSVDKFWGEFQFGTTTQAVLIERMTFGAGVDTVDLTRGRFFSKSAAGFHARVDSSFQPTAVLFPNMGQFSKGYAVSMTGRGPQDSLLLAWKRETRFQKLYLREGNNATPVTPMREDSNVLVQSIGPSENGKTYFLGHRYAVLAGVKTTLSVGTDTIKDLFSNKPGDAYLDTAVDLQGLRLDSLRILVKRALTFENLEPSSGFILVLKGFSPNRAPRLRGFILRGGKWDSVGVIHRNGYFQFQGSLGDRAFVAAEILQPGDTLPVNPVSNPSVLLQDGRLLVKPILSSGEAARLSSFTVEILVMDANGKWTVETSNGLPGDSTFSYPYQEEKFYSARIAYESFSGNRTWKALPLPQGVSSFLTGVLAQAKPYKPAVWELISLPWPGTVKKDLKPRFSSREAREVKVEEWNGTWEPISDDATFQKGRGYLAGFPKEVLPVAPDTYSWDLAPESIALDTGWQIIANPFPCPIAEASVRRTFGAVSFFYELLWEGSGKAATPIWKVADTLRPLKGYAVHVRTASSLVFELRPNFTTAKIRVETKSLEVQMRDEEGLLRGQLFVQPPEAPRPSPYPPFFRGGLSAHWADAEGPISLVRAQGRPVDEVIVVNSPVPRQVFLTQTHGRDPPSKSILALWNPRLKTLSTLSEIAEVHLEAGENWFRILEVDEASLRAKEADLARESVDQLVLLQNAPNPFAGSTRFTFTIPLYLGSQSHVDIEIRSFAGRVVYHKALGRIVPGRYTLALEGDSWPPGQYIARATFQGPQGRKVLSRKMLRLGGSP